MPPTPIPAVQFDVCLSAAVIGAPSLALGVALPASEIGDKAEHAIEHAVLGLLGLASYRFGALSSRVVARRR